MNKEICLYGLEQAALILLSDKGVVYHNQVGGTACMQPREKGFLIPITNDPPLVDLYRGSLGYKLSSVCQDIYIDEEMANKVDAVLKEELHNQRIRIDRMHLSKSMEAWIYVTVDSGSEDIKGFTETSAILTWPNSD